MQLEVDDLRRISVHLAPIPQPPTQDNIVARQKIITLSTTTFVLPIIEESKLISENMSPNVIHG